MGTINTILKANCGSTSESKWFFEVSDPFLCKNCCNLCSKRVVPKQQSRIGIKLQTLFSMMCPYCKDSDKTTQTCIHLK